MTILPTPSPLRPTTCVRPGAPTKPKLRGKQANGPKPRPSPQPRAACCGVLSGRPHPPGLYRLGRRPDTRPGRAARRARSRGAQIYACAWRHPVEVRPHAAAGTQLRAADRTAARGAASRPRRIQFADGLADGCWRARSAILLLPPGRVTASPTGCGAVPHVITLRAGIGHEDAAVLTQRFWHNIGLDLAPGQALDEALTHCAPAAA